jgi:hypothetical protein
MRPAARFVNTLVAVAALTACDGGRTQLPTAPSSPPPSASPPPSPSPPLSASGQITLRSIAPGSGATLTVRECPTSFTDSFKDLCSDPAHMTVDVEFGRDVSTAVVTAAFYSGTKRCGVASSGPSPFAAGSRASFELLGAIELSDESVQLHCPLPAETTRMVIQLWEASRPATPLLTQDFAHSYAFAEP